MANFTAIVLLALICLSAITIVITINRILFNWYKTEFSLLSDMFRWVKNGYLISDIEFHSCRMTKHKNIILNTMIENDFVVPEQKDTLRQIINEDSDERELNVATSTRNLSEEEIHTLRDKVSFLLIKVKFDFPIRHKELKSDIQQLLLKIDDFIEDMDKNKEKEEENDSQNSYIPNMD